MLRLSRRWLSNVSNSGIPTRLLIFVLFACIGVYHITKTKLIALMSNPSDPSQPPNTQNHRENNTSEAEPPSSLVTFKQRLGTLLVFVWRFCCDIGSDDCNKPQANGLSDLLTVSTHQYYGGVLVSYLGDCVEDSTGQSLGLRVEDGRDQQIRDREQRVSTSGVENVRKERCAANY